LNFVPTARLIDWVGAKRFRYKNEGDRGRLFKQDGSHLRVVIKKSAAVSKAYAEIVLRQAGYTNQEIADLFATLPPPTTP
jgi:hypothetical protein